jgi:hypothetical protein
VFFFSIILRFQIFGKFSTVLAKLVDFALKKKMSQKNNLPPRNAATYMHPPGPI